MGHSVLHTDDLYPKQLVSKTIQGNKLYQPPMPPTPPPPGHTFFFLQNDGLGPKHSKKLRITKILLKISTLKVTKHTIAVHFSLFLS